MTPEFSRGIARGRRWLKENTKRLAFKRLKKDVIDRGACIECGTCVGICPENVLADDDTTVNFVPTLVGKCIACGLCYAFCPRTVVFWDELIGDVRSAWQARAVDRRGQNGGVASALLEFALSKGYVDGVIAVQSSASEPWKPEAKIITEAKHVQSTGGTIYSHAPVVNRMLEAMKTGLSRLAVVGTACKINAIARLEVHPAAIFQTEPDLFALKIGLFCMESFDYNGLKDFLGQAGIEIKNVEKMEISGGKFKVFSSGEIHEWPVAELDHIAASSCSYCHDLTCLNADISCGNIGSDVEWTTVLVRTIQGEHLFQEAVAEGIIEAEELEEKSLRAIQNVARSKATRYYSLPSHGSSKS